MRHPVGFSVLSVVAAVTVVACARDASVPTGTRSVALDLAAPEALGEGELLGDLYLNGVAITDTGYKVSLTPVDSQTSARLHYYNGIMWVAPTGHDSGRVPQAVEIRSGDPRGEHG